MEIKLTNENFDTEVTNADIPVMVDFWAEWCGPCKMLAPFVKEAAEKYQGKLKVCKVNIDENMDLAQQYKIVSIPTLVFFKDGNATDRSIGFVDKERLFELIDRVIE